MSIRISEAITHRLGPYAHRLQPRTLRGRLALAAFLSSVLGVALTFGLVRFATVRYFDDLAQATARQHIAALHSFLGAEQDDLDLNASMIAAALQRHASDVETSAAAPVWLTERLGSARASAFVRVDGDGHPAYAQGTASEVAALRSLIAGLPDGGASGLVWGGGRLLFVAAEPLEVEGRRGFVAVARPADDAVARRLTSLSDGLSVTFGPPSTTQLVSDGSPLGGFDRVRLQVTGGTVHAAIQVPGLGSKTGAIARLELTDRRITGAMTAGGEAALGAAAFVGVLAAVFGLALGAAVSAPIDRTRRFLRDEGPLALEGLPTVPLSNRMETTTELRDLATDVDGLLSALARRQAELVEATALARAAEESLRAALDGSLEGKLLIDGDEVVLANRAAEQILEVPLAELVGKRADDALAIIPAFAEDGHRYDSAEAAEFSTQAPLTARVDTEPERWVEATQVVLAGDPPRVLLSIRDVTEERHLDAMREEIFSIVSHDLRAPLTVIQGYLDILERPLQPEARARALESARHNAVKMAGLLEDLLDATAADRLLAPKVMQPVDVLALAEDVASSARETAVGHTVQVVAEAERAIVSGEERRLSQALVNLVTNAVKYAPEHTTVTVRVSTADSLVLLAVEDEGPGIPAEAREAVFERYGRLASTSEGKPGFGLGLYIVRIIAEKHGGRAIVEEAPGGGARFVIELPSADEV